MQRVPERMNQKSSSSHCERVKGTRSGTIVLVTERYKGSVKLVFTHAHTHTRTHAHTHTHL